MPKIEFNVDNKKQSTDYNYPKLKLKKEEKARILIIEEPNVEYVHNLRKPVVRNGQIVQETKQKRDGSSYEQNKMDFVSRTICLGDFSILTEKGSDPKNCPMCALAKDEPDKADAPVRRFAMHVIKYGLKANTTQVRNPYTTDLVVWAFTDRVYSQIVDAQEEWAEHGGLKKHDVILTCTNDVFQNYDISVSPEAAYLKNAETKKITISTFQENQIPDLAIACGSKKERKWIDQDIESIHEAWNAVSGSETTEEVDFDSMLGNESESPEETFPDSIEEDFNVEDLFSEGPVTKPAEESAPATEAETAEDADDEDIDLDDFASILNED